MPLAGTPRSPRLHDDRLERAAHDADREDLLGVDVEHLRPDARPLVGVPRHQPPLVELDQAPRGGEGRGLAVAALALEVGPPLGPLELLLAHRREPVRAHVGRRQPEAEVSVVGAHHGLAREDAAPEHLQLARADQELDPQLRPGVLHELQHVRVLRLLAGRLHDEIEPLPVRAEPEAAAVPRSSGPSRRGAGWPAGGRTARRRSGAPRGRPGSGAPCSARAARGRSRGCG